MEGNFSNRVQDVIRLSREEALRLGHDYIGTEHLLLGVIREGEGIAVKILRNLGVDLYKLKKAIEDTVRTSGGTLTIGNIPLTKQAEKVLKITYLEAKLYKSDVIGTEHLLLSLLRDDDNIAAQILHQFNIHYDVVRGELDNIISGKPSTPPHAQAAADIVALETRLAKAHWSKVANRDANGNPLAAGGAAVTVAISGANTAPRVTCNGKALAKLEKRMAFPALSEISVL